MPQPLTQFNGEPQFTAPAQCRPFRLAQANFYITNVCNLACRGCWSLNNLAVSGHCDWQHSQARVEQWARLVDIDSVSIVGGEPLLHPDLDQWVKELRRLWPQTDQEFTIVTNGTQLKHSKPDLIKDWFELGVALEISVHDPEHWPEISQWCQDLLSDLAEPYEIQVRMNQGLIRHDHVLGDGTRLIALAQHWQFYPAALKSLAHGSLEFHTSDASTAHDNCAVRQCHYFVDGIMYKCPLTAAAAAGIPQQFRMQDRHRQLLAKIKGCDPLTTTDLASWFRSLDRTIPQCSLCPEYPQQREPIWPLPTTKPRISRVNIESIKHESTVKP